MWYRWKDRNSDFVPWKPFLTSDMTQCRGRDYSNYFHQDWFLILSWEAKMSLVSQIQLPLRVVFIIIQHLNHSDETTLAIEFESSKFHSIMNFFYHYHQKSAPLWRNNPISINLEISSWHSCCCSSVDPVSKGVPLQRWWCCRDLIWFSSKPSRCYRKKTEPGKWESRLPYTLWVVYI